MLPSFNRLNASWTSLMIPLTTLGVISSWVAKILPFTGLIALIAMTSAPIRFHSRPFTAQKRMHPQNVRHHPIIGSRHWIVG
jgi:hypothetical protein